MNQFMINGLLSAIDKGTKVGPLDAFLIAVIGVAIVFGVLAVLMFAIWLMGFIFQKTPLLAKKFPQIAGLSAKLKNAFKFRKKLEQDAQNAQPQVQELASGSCGELVLVNTTERDAAMIMAIVADATETPLNQLYFKSIKKIEEGEEL